MNVNKETSVGSRSRIRHALLTSAVIAGSCITATPVWAADGAEVEAAAASSGGDENDIIVTAQRRAQRLQDVPIAISAFNQASLNAAGVGNSRDLAQVVPALTLPQSVFYVQPMIRGVGSYNTHVGDEPNVATYIDGVYISQMLGSYYQLANIERVEVLKGPQGTLFGRNATGGAINIVTREPGQELKLEAGLSYGRFNAVDANVYVQGGLAPSIAVGVTGSYNYRDGYYRNLASGTKEGKLKSYAFRAKTLIDATDNLRFTLIGDIARRDSASGILYHVVDRNSVAETQGFNTTSGDYDIDQNFSPFNVIKQKGLSLQAALDLGSVDLISVSAFRSTDQRSMQDGDGTRANITIFQQSTRVRDYMQELRLNSKPGSAVQWIVGGFLYSSDARYKPLIARAMLTSPPQLNLFARQKTLALAGFADVTVPITEQISIAGGIRYSTEERKYESTRPPAAQLRAPDVRFNSWTPRAVLSYKPTDAALIYASFSKGFKSGGYTTSSPGTLPYKPEKLTAYELGTKLTLAPGISLNMAAYKYDYKNLQISATTASNVVLAILANAATAKMKGFEAELSARVSPALTLNAGVAYSDAKYGKFENATVFIPRVAGIPGAGNRVCVDGRATGGANECDVSGNRIARAPKFTFNAGGAYRHDLAGGQAIVASGNVYHSSGYPWEPSGRLRQKSYEMVNAQLEYQLADNRLSFAIWGKNLTNSRVFIAFAPNGSSDRGEFDTPVTYGGTVKFRF